MLRGQWIGAGLGFVGILGCLILIGMGHDTAGVTFGSVVVLSLVGTFVYGRKDQKAEREEKAAIAERIKAGLPPMEDTDGPEDDE
jgi:hypothetical protein